MFVQHALGGRVQGNWPAIVYPAAAIAAVAVWPRLHRPAVALGAAITLAVYVQATRGAVAAAGPARSIRAAARRLGRAGGAGRGGARGAPAPASSSSRNTAWHRSWRWRLPAGVPVVGEEPRWALFRLPPARLARCRRHPGPQRAGAAAIPEGGAWSAIAAVGSADRSRSGASIEGYLLYRVVARDTEAPLVLLPRP